MKLRNVVVYGSLAILLSGCANTSLYGGQYWERKDMSDAAWQNGPRVQTMLNRDIARCVTDIKEADRTSTLRNDLPDGPNPTVTSEDEKELSDWNNPSHQGALLAEHSDYHDFDGCMNAKGWRRVETIPYDDASQARDNYYRAHVKYGEDPAKKRPKGSSKPAGDFSSLNN
jgi:hypothetical protein